MQTITKLPDDDVILLKPIEYNIDDLGDNNFVASVIGANLNASGDTIEEVAANLSDIVGGMFRLLHGEPSSDLPRPMRELRDFLDEHVGFVVGGPLTPDTDSGQ